MRAIHILRSLWRARLTFVIVVVTLGMTASLTLIASRVAYATFFRPLPYDHLNAVVSIEDQAAAQRWQEAATGERPFAAFSVAARLHSGQATLVTQHGSAFRATVTQVSEAFFRVVDVTPTTGLLLSGHSPTAPVALVSDTAASRFDLSTDPLGQTVSLNGHALTIVGVLPSSAAFPATTDLWVPEQTLGQNVFRGTIVYHDIARLSPGTTVGMAERELREALGPRAEPRVQVLRGSLTAASSPAVIALLGASLAVFLAAAVNLCHLLLVRANDRRGAFAVCAALGASPLTIFKIVVVEQLVLSGCAAIVAVLSAQWWHAVLAQLLPADTLGLADGVAEWRVFLALLVLFGAIALSLSGVIYVVTARTSPRGEDGLRLLESRSVGRPKGSRWLIATEVSATVAVVALAAALLGSVTSVLGRGNEGIRANVYAVDVELPDSRSSEAATFFPALEERLKTSGRFQDVSLSNSAPFSKAPMFALRFSTAPKTGEPVAAEFRIVSERYFETLGIGVVAGRACTSHDRKGGQRVAMVSSDIADRLWPSETALGRRIRIEGAPPEFTYDIVGVVRPTRHRDLVENKTDSAVYACFGQTSPPYMTVLVASRAGRAETIGAIRAAIHDVDPSVAPGTIRTVEEARRDSIGGAIAGAILASLLAILAVCLCALGIYAILTLDTRARSREIAVRLVCGATRIRVLADLVRPVLIVASLGAIAGALASLWLVTTIRRLVPGSLADGPLVVPIVGTALLVILFATCVAFVGVMKAASVEPAELLKTRT